MQMLRKPKKEPEIDNGILDNGNGVPMDLDFGTPPIKIEPMEYENHLNANRPQDAALNPGAAAVMKSKDSTATTPTTKVKTESSKFSTNLEIKALQKKPSSLKSKSGDIKPSVSITPVSSADLNLKKPSSSGFEIIPLGDKMPENSEKTKKDIKRSLSEDDKRRLEKKEKKRKHDLLMSKDGKKYSSSSGSSSKKLSSLIDRLSSSSHNDSGIEIIPSGKYPSSDKLKNSLKLTIKSSPSSSSKSRDRDADRNRKSHHSSSSRKEGKIRPGNYVKSSPGSKPSSKSAQLQRDKDRIEEVKRLIGNNKLDTTTFQIPKRSKPDSGQSTPKYNTSPLKSSPGKSENSPSSKPTSSSSSSPSPQASLSFMSLPTGQNSSTAPTQPGSCDKDINSIGMNNSK